MLKTKNIFYKYLKGKLFFLFLIILTCDVSAQLSAIHAFARTQNLLVIGEKNDTLLYPFAGGLNSCQFANMDINLDGIDDLLVFDRHGNKILPFIVLPATPGKYLFEPELASKFPPIEQWMQAVDYNQDGKKDIFTYTTGGIKVYRNDSEGTLKFKQVTQPFLFSLQGTTLTNILVTYADYPAIIDIDNDGDLDILTFWGLGSFVEWHKNTSVERFGRADSLTFEKASSCWGHFAEGKEDNKIILDTCSTSGMYSKSSNIITDDTKHTGSTFLVQDLNGDGLPDITLGDVDFSTLVHLTNGGTIANAKMISQTTNFPNTQEPVKMNSFPASMLVDVDNDGKKDLLISPFEPSLTKGENFKSVSLYHNSGTITNPNYHLSSKSFLQDQMLDFGSGAYPVLFDYNKDGLMDILVGNYGYTDTCIYLPSTGLQCTYKAKIALLINEGTATKPQFRLANRNVAGLDVLEMQSLIPAVGDMDGDGDMDLVCGNSKGKLVYCENKALPGKPADFQLIDPAWKSIDIGDFSAPQLFDVDQDGLIDLICGKRTGTLNYYKNTGTLQMPEFSLVTEQLGGVDVTNHDLSNNGYSVPLLYKDKQGKILLFSGSESGDLFVYDQINANLNGNFNLLGIIPGIKEGWRTSLALGNLNNDTLTDILIGNYSGGLDLFLGKADKLFSIKELNNSLLVSMKLVPNPASEVVSISVNSDFYFKPESLVIQSMHGRIIRKFAKINFPFLIEISDFPNGIYLVSVQYNAGKICGKLAICR